MKADREQNPKRIRCFYGRWNGGRSLREGRAGHPCNYSERLIPVNSWQRTRIQQSTSNENLAEIRRQAGDDSNSTTETITEDVKPLFLKAHHPVGPPRRKDPRPPRRWYRRWISVTTVICQLAIAVAQ